mmetsp:Transcript_57695/g.134420  ORF Transcript_57695/g.134420 Transcript_57695/m.134420 type:complete len:321 (-) Transcript_57695:98-1060(-)
MSSTASAAKPLVVLIDPNWSFDLENFDVESFFQEAKVTKSSIAVLQNRFSKFCVNSDRTNCDRAYLTPDGFHRMNECYSICKPQEEQHFFRAMDRTGTQRISFQDLLLGCSAACPVTPHILNSFTGYVRAHYIFDYYNASRSGTLEYEELARLLADAHQLDDDSEAQRARASEIAQDLGEVSVVTLRVSGISGPLCDVRVSTRWTGLRVRREIARQLQVPVEGQELLMDQRPLLEGEVLDRFVPAGATSANVTLVRTDWDRWPCAPEPSASDGVGIERLIHVTFHRLYQALVSEQLRGTSRLFRFHRSIMYSKKGAVGGA